MGKIKFSAGLWCFGGCADRFNPGGYSEFMPVEEQIRLAGQVRGLEGVEFHWSTDFEKMDFAQAKALLKENNLVASNMNVNTFSFAKWKHGAFTNRDERLRREAVELAKAAVNAAKEVGAESVGLWLGADGYDYPFQADYRLQWEYLVEGIREVAEVDPNMLIGIEYKLKEPRTHIQIGTVGKALYICNETGLDNVGVALDFGHALMSRENPADSVALLARSGKLFNIHFNDAYGEWDDDMIPGTVHLWETVEYLYYLKLTNYNKWLGLDMFPYREDPVRACDMALRNIEGMMSLAEKIHSEALAKAWESMDAVATQEVVRKIIFQ